MADIFIITNRENLRLLISNVIRIMIKVNALLQWFPPRNWSSNDMISFDLDSDLMGWAPKQTRDPHLIAWSQNALFKTWKMRFWTPWERTSVTQGRMHQISSPPNKSSWYSMLTPASNGRSTPHYKGKTLLLRGHLAQEKVRQLRTWLLAILLSARAFSLWRRKELQSMP